MAIQRTLSDQKILAEYKLQCLMKNEKEIISSQESSKSSISSFVNSNSQSSNSSEKSYCLSDISDEEEKKSG